MPSFVRSAADRLPPRRRLITIAAIIATVLGVLGAILIYSPVAHPRTVDVNGATGASARHIEQAMEDAAHGQSTFHVSEGALMDAVADYPEVSSVEVQAHPPFRLDLTVVMRPPVGRVEFGGRQFAVAGDGTVLRRAGSSSVPKIDSSVGSITVSDGVVRGGAEALAILSSAPEALLGLTRVIRQTSSGFVVELQRGPRLIFGTGEGVREKWAAAAAVLAQGAAVKASYIDLRVPARPAVGGLGGSRAAGDLDQASPLSLTAASPAAEASATGSAQSAPAEQSATAEAPAQTQTQAQTTDTGGATAAVGDGGQSTTSGAAAAPPVTAAPATASTGGASVSGGATP